MSKKESNPPPPVEGKPSPPPPPPNIVVRGGSQPPKPMTLIDQVDIYRALSIPGWMSEEELLWLASTSSISHNVVEIGSYCGRSSRAIGDHLPPDGSLYCIDSFKPFHCIPPVISSSEEGEEICKQFITNMDDLISSGKVSLLRVSSLQAAMTINKRMTGWVDFLFIDGDHSYQAVMNDITIWLPLMAKSGIISGHDYDIYEGVNRAVDERFGGIVERPAGSIWCVRL